MPTKKSTKTRKSKPEANGVHRRPKWEIEMERTIDEMVAPLEGDTTDSRANLRKLLRPSFEFANQYAVFKWHWEGKGKRRTIESDGVVFHAKDYKDVQRFLETIPDDEQQYYNVHFME
jgi:hypothetical protein